MDLSNDPEIICVFCGLGFASVENVELHILENHQSNHIDHQMESRKTGNIDDFANHIISDDSFFMSNEMKEINLIVRQKDLKLDSHFQESAESIPQRVRQKVSLKSNKRPRRLLNVTHKASDHSKDVQRCISENYNINDHHKAHAMLTSSDTINNIVDERIQKIMKRNLRCQNCDKQFTLSNNLSRHRRLYCSSLKENNGQEKFFQNDAIPPFNKTDVPPNQKCIRTNKPGHHISKPAFQNSDVFCVKKKITRKKIIKPLQKYNCPNCYKRFIFKLTQMLHKQSHKDRKWRCDKCGYRFSKKQILLHHNERSCVKMTYSPEPNNEEYLDSNSCRFCKLTFANSVYLEIHKRKICQRNPSSTRFHQIDAVNNNNNNNNNNSKSNSSSQSRIKNEEKLYELSKYEEICDHPIFENELSPQSPGNRLYVNNQKEINSTMTSNPKFHWHNCNDEMIQQKSFQCEVCKKSFSSRSSLSNHIKSHYSSRGQPFTCRDCNRRFVNLISLQDHRREMCSQKSNESDQKTVYNLNNFNGVSQVPIWQNITNSHSGNQPVTCLHCNGTFYDRLELEEHALSKHSNEHGNILCLLCDRSFSTNMALRVHLTKSHGFANGGCPGVSQNLPPMPKLETNYHIGDDFTMRKRKKERTFFNNDKEYFCDNCHRNFSTGQALGNHKRACLNMPNEPIPMESKPSGPNLKSNSKIHSIESLIFDNTNLRPSFSNDKNVFLAFN